MAETIPHLDWPITFDEATGGLRQNQQDTRADVLACVNLLTSVTQGELRDNLAIGRPDVAFLKGPIHAAIVEQALREQEDRAPISVTVESYGNEPQVAVNVDTTGLQS